MLFGCIGWELGASVSLVRPGSSLPPWAGGGGGAEGPAQCHPPRLFLCPLGLREEVSFSGVMG